MRSVILLLVALLPCQAAITHIESVHSDGNTIIPNGAIVSGTYTSGITATGSTGQTCNLTAFNGAGSSVAATATVALTGTNTIASSTVLVMTQVGEGYTGNSTTATAGNGTATCSGTATVATTRGEAWSLTLTSSVLHDHWGCVTFWDSGSGGTFTSLSDAKSNTYANVLAATSFDGANQSVRVDEVKDAIAGVTTIITKFGGAVNVHGSTQCGHDSGLDLTTPADQALFNATATGATTWTSGNSGTLANANEIVYGFALCAIQADCKFVAGSGFTSLSHVGNGGAGLDMALEYQIVSATTALAATGTICATTCVAANSVYVGLTSFQQAAGGASNSITPSHGGVF